MIQFHRLWIASVETDVCDDTDESFNLDKAIKIKGVLVLSMLRYNLLAVGRVHSKSILPVIDSEKLRLWTIQFFKNDGERLKDLSLSLI